MEKGENEQAKRELNEEELSPIWVDKTHFMMMQNVFALCENSTAFLYLNFLNFYQSTCFSRI